MSPHSRHSRPLRWWLLVLTGAFVALVVGLLARPAPVAAKPGFLTAFRTTYPAVMGTALDSCTVCHTSAIPALNAYGSDYLASNHNLAAIEMLDSDHDGAANIVEIRALTFPGDAGSVPASTPTPTATSIPVNPTATPTATSIPVNPTATPTATSIPVNPTATPTATGISVDPTATPTATTVPTNPTPTPTSANLPGARVEFTGQIQAMSATIWVVGDRTLRVDGDTEIDDEDGRAVIGAWAEVKAIVEGDGGLYAREIEIKEHAEETPEATHTPEPTHEPEHTRTPEATHEPEHTRTPEATHEPEHTRTPEATHEPEPTHTPEPTHEPEHTRTPEPTHTPEATQTPEHEMEIEWEGRIESISPTSWVVAGRTVTLAEFTSIRRPERAVVGAIAKVKALRLDDGTLLAVEIEIEDSASQMYQKIEWVGLLEQIGADSWTVGGRTVQLNAFTRIEGVPHLGDRVEVQAQRQADGTLLALRLHVDIADNTVEWRGIVDAITPAAWQISGRNVSVNARTVFDEQDGPLGVGVWVEVKALRQADGSLLALRIRTED